MNAKRVLILAYFYPPKNDMGSLRPTKLAKYLPDFGWEPIVLTAQGEKKDGGLEEVPGVKVYRTKSAFSLVNPILKKSDRVGYWRYGLDNALDILKDTPYDLIFSTAGPMRINILASKIQKATGLPWVAEFRDPWTDNHYQKIKSRFLLSIEGQKEVRTMKGAELLTTVSQPWVDLISKRHGYAKKVIYIPNGFDPEDYDAQAEKTDKFTMTYTGGLYSDNEKGRRDLRPLFEAIAKLKKEAIVSKDDFEVRFIGSNRAHVETDAALFGINDLVRVYDRVPYGKSVQFQKESTALLMLSANIPQERAVYSGKIYEYLGAGRPILAMPRNSGSVVEELLENTNAGELCTSPQEAENVLRSWLTTFRQMGKLESRVAPESLIPYTWKEQTRQFASIFNDLAEAGKRGRV